MKCCIHNTGLGGVAYGPGPPRQQDSSTRAPTTCALSSLHGDFCDIFTWLGPYASVSGICFAINSAQCYRKQRGGDHVFKMGHLFHFWSAKFGKLQDFSNVASVLIHLQKLKC